MLRAGGEECEAIDDDVFRSLRLEHDVLTTDRALHHLDWTRLTHAGGKGGANLAYVTDASSGAHLVVKELSPHDHLALRSLARPLVHHLSRHPETLLAPIYAHLRRPGGALYMVMRNCLPPRAPLAAGTASSAIFDLKGTQDDKTLVWLDNPVPDVHKRFYNVCMRLCDCVKRRSPPALKPHAISMEVFAPGRRYYSEGKRRARRIALPLTPAQRDWVLERMRVDCAFLRHHQLMDYSLLLRVSASPLGAAQPVEHDTAATMPLECKHDGMVWEYSFGIIDYLQAWTWSKRVARCIKCLETNKSTEPPDYYASRFLRYFERKLEPVAVAWSRSPCAQPLSGSVEALERLVLGEGAAALQASPGHPPAAPTTMSPLRRVRAILQVLAAWLSLFRRRPFSLLQQAVSGAPLL